MTQPLLSVLIPTVVGREKQFSELLSKLAQMGEFHNGTMGVDLIIDGISNNEVEVLSLKDNKEITIGEKRENLYKLANGLYSWQIDDDDLIAPNAIELILNAIKNNPEVPCITFREKCMMNGVYKSSNHSIRYSQWMDNQDGFDYVRSPFYKDVIRTDIARSVPFPHIRYNEDEQWSKALYPLLTDEIHIDEELYHYIYNETNHNERYGLDK
ncbi:MAG TPA: glycosyltransferase family A protein [Bacteroidia bacterium]|jgi:hypothetical protein|nr:glycosyltransferase family A protein [Bacteroidia bacterium]